MPRKAGPPHLGSVYFQPFPTMPILPTWCPTTQTQHQHQTQPAEHVPDLAVTPASDTSISPASVNNALPSRGGSFDIPTQTVFINPNPKRGSSPLQPTCDSVENPSDDNDDEDALSAGTDRACFNTILIDYEFPVLCRKPLGTVIFCFASFSMSCGCGLLCPPFFVPLDQ
jgi:hypothetical protein